MRKLLAQSQIHKKIKRQDYNEITGFPHKECYKEFEIMMEILAGRTTLIYCDKKMFEKYNNKIIYYYISACSDDLNRYKKLT